MNPNAGTKLLAAIADDALVSMMFASDVPDRDSNNFLFTVEFSAGRLGSVQGDNADQAARILEQVLHDDRSIGTMVDGRMVTTTIRREGCGPESILAIEIFSIFSGAASSTGTLPYRESWGEALVLLGLPEPQSVRLPYDDIRKHAAVLAVAQLERQRIGEATLPAKAAKPQRHI